MHKLVMAECTEQRACIKFCFKLGKSAAECYENLKVAFGDQAMSRTQVFEWFRKFKNGRQSIESDARTGRPATSNNDIITNKVRDLIKQDRRLTVREIAEEVGISCGSCHSILTKNLNMKRLCAKFVPRLLTDEQRDQRRFIASDLFERATEDAGFMSNIVTCDETWVYGYDPETKQQSSEWRGPTSPRPKKARQQRSNVKVMLIVFFDIRGIVYYEYAPPGQTINKTYYVDVLKRFRNAMRRKRPALWRSGNWLLHQDNAPAHTSQLVQCFLAKHGIAQVPQPPYSPDLAPCDFFLFPQLKVALKGKRFEDVPAIQENATEHLLGVTLDAFELCYQQWQERWAKCVASEGAYFEGD
jgi:transposase